MPVRETSAPAASFDHLVLETVARIWGYDTLRPMQAEAIRASLEQRDSLVVMPTGGGKSLCYQVPPLINGKLAVVVSPLISLMKDQVDGLRLAGYPAAAMHSNLDASEVSEIREGVSAGEIKLLLVAPERLLTTNFLTWLARLHSERGIGSFAIDEAHCISQWGHDFRPEYRRLADLREVFPDLPLHAYTATATPRVREDIVAQLKLKDPAVLVGCFDRPNLTYRVLPRMDEVAQVEEVLKRHDGRASIIYCISRKDTESLAATLRHRRIEARPYHAGLDAKTRTNTQADFKTERLNVVVATVAFGMGIDRGDVRCVIHAAMPKTVEHYQQETGRAGRDGLPAECVLLYSGADVMRWKQVMQRGADESTADAESVARGLAIQFELLDHMQRLCNGARCRHRALSEYFGQPYTPPPGDGGDGGGCGACDCCLHELATIADSNDVARKILSCVYRVGQAFGAAHVADVLRGGRTARITERKHDQLSTHGLLRHLPREAIISYINQLIDAGVLDRTRDEFPVLRLNGESGAVLKNERQVALFEPKVNANARAVSLESGAPLSAEDQPLFEALRTLRKQIADELNLPPYTVFADTTLQEMAKVRPGSAQAFIGIKGVGQNKLANFGTRFINFIRDYCNRNNLPLDAAAGSRSRRVVERESRADKPPTARNASAHLFAQGLSIDDVAEARGITRNTAAAHLAQFIIDTRPDSIERWVDGETYRAVADAAEKFGTAMLRPIFDHLGGKVPYDQIRLVVNHLK